MGVAEDDPALPEEWSATQNVQWTADVPGWGWSGPVIWGDKVFVTSVSSDGDYEKPKKGLYLGSGRPTPPEGSHEWKVFCFDLQSGEIIWEETAHRGQPQIPRHPKNTFASETPVTDGERLYVLFGDVGLYCYDLDGKLLWSHDIEPKETQYGYGAAASPVLQGDKLIMVYDNNEESFIAAFDKESGKQLWRTARDEPSTWATPFVWENDRRTEIVTAGMNMIRSYDPDGNLLWEMNGRMSHLTIPSPFAALGMLYITSGYIGDDHRPVYAIRPGASGDITLEEGEGSNEFVAWYLSKAGPYNPSPIIYRGLYYTLHDRGFLTCHDALTGELVYDRQRIDRGASFTSSPWAYNGKIFCLSEEGDTYVIKAGPDYELLGKNSLEEFCVASPAVAQGKLLIRTASRLYCIGN